MKPSKEQIEAAIEFLKPFVDDGKFELDFTLREFEKGEADQDEVDRERARLLCNEASLFALRFLQNSEELSDEMRLAAYQTKSINPDDIWAAMRNQLLKEIEEEMQ